MKHCTSKLSFILRSILNKKGEKEENSALNKIFGMAI
jgi:hypothetical protein